MLFREFTLPVERHFNLSKHWFEIIKEAGSELNNFFKWLKKMQIAIATSLCSFCFLAACNTTQHALTVLSNLEPVS